MPELIQLALKITPAAQLRERDQQVDGEDKEVPHTTNRTMAVSARWAARRGRIPSYYEFATHTLKDPSLPEIRINLLERAHRAVEFLFLFAQPEVFRPAEAVE